MQPKGDDGPEHEADNNRADRRAPIRLGIDDAFRRSRAYELARSANAQMKNAPNSTTSAAEPLAMRCARPKTATLHTIG